MTVIVEHLLPKIYINSFPKSGTHLAILITARRWTQNYEWMAHRKIAEQAGP